MASFLSSLLEINPLIKDEKHNLLAYENGKFTCLSVPNGYFNSLCFDNHEDLEHLTSEVNSKSCDQDKGHVHAHIHHGETREEILLEQCCQELTCVIPPPNKLSKCATKNVSNDDDHQHNIECGHKRIPHGDHHDWLLPMPDGSFLIQHSHESEQGGNHCHDNGRLVRVGAAKASYKRRPHLYESNVVTGHFVDIFSYEMSSHQGYGAIHHEKRSTTRVVDEVTQVDHSEKSHTEIQASTTYTEKEINEDDLKRTVLDVLGICCPSEVPLIRRILEPMPGVVEVSVNVISKTTTVLHDPMLTSDTLLVKALNEARLEASVHRRGKSVKTDRWPNVWVLLCGLLLAIAFFKYIFEPLQYIAIASVVVGLPRILLKSLAALRRFVVDINTLMLIAVVGAIALGDYLEAGSVIFLFSIAEWLESRSTQRAREALESIYSMSPQTAVVFETGLRINTEDVKIGSFLAVKPGEMIPIDGIVVEGNGAVDESSLTGESIAVSKSSGMEVFGGTLNIAGFLKIQTTAKSSDSAVSRMVRLVEDAQSQRSRSELLVDSFAKYYTPLVIFAALSMILIPIAVNAHNTRHWIYLALVLLVVACPCALVISTPVTVVCGVAQAAKNGLIIKGGEHLETLAKVQIVSFDKTGTLTQGRFQVSNFLPFGDSDNKNLKEILHWVSSVENLSSHPLAPALVSYARIRGVSPSSSVTKYEMLAGEGISANVGGNSVQIGNKRMLQRLGLLPDLEETVFEAWEKEGGTVSFVVVDDKLVAVFSVADSPRAEASDAIHQLRSMGLRVAMLTGDNQGSANSIQSLIDPTMEVFAQLLPEDKVSIVADLKAQGTVAMVGDGINDAPALASADVGIAMGVAGSAIAMETADVALMRNDLCQLPCVIKLAKKCRAKMIQNISFSFFTKAVVIVLSAVGYASLWLALLTDVGTCLLVVFNSVLILEKSKKAQNKACVFEELDLGETKKSCCESGECEDVACSETGRLDDDLKSDKDCCKKEMVEHSHTHSHMKHPVKSCCASESKSCSAAAAADNHSKKAVVKFCSETKSKGCPETKSKGCCEFKSKGCCETKSKGCFETKSNGHFRHEQENVIDIHDVTDCAIALPPLSTSHPQSYNLDLEDVE